MLLLALSVSACATPPTVTLHPTVEPKGRIVLLPKTPFRVAANYQLRVSRNGVDLAYGISTAAGGAAVRDLEPGLYRVKINGPDLKTIRLNVKVRDGKVTLITLPVEEAPRAIEPRHDVGSLLAVIVTYPLRVACYALAILFCAGEPNSPPALFYILEALARSSSRRK